MDEVIFVRWLEREIRAAEFEALTLAEVRERAGRELGIDEQRLFGWIAKNAGRGGRFRSRDGVISMRRI